MTDVAQHDARCSPNVLIGDFGEWLAHVAAGSLGEFRLTLRRRDANAVPQSVNRHLAGPSFALARNEHVRSDP